MIGLERGSERRGSDRRGERPEERAEAESWLPGRDPNSGQAGRVLRAERKGR